MGNSKDCPPPPPPPRTQPTYFYISFATHACINEIKMLKVMDIILVL